MIKPAIVAVGYNRPACMKRLLESVAAAVYPDDGIRLIVSIDECDMSDKVEEAAKSVEWDHGSLQIIRYKERQGLRKHILQCGDLSQQYGAVIILEDDLWVSPSFYTYTLEAVNKYADNSSVAGIALYSHSWNGYANQPFYPSRNGYDAYFGQFSITWGQCWTAAQWNRFRTWYRENENRLPDINYNMPVSISRWGDQSWGKYFVSYVVEKELFYVVPYVAMSTNFSEVGQHNSRVSTSHQVALLEGIQSGFRLPEPEHAVKYDVFFERMLSQNHTVAGVTGQDIICDFYGSRRIVKDKPYLLSAAQLPFEKLASFGLQLRPIEANAIYNTPGEDLFLYKLPAGETALEQQPMSTAVSDYYLFDFNWRILRREFIVRLCRGIRGRIERIKRKWLKRLEGVGSVV